MTVEYTPEALADLDAIWDWNARKYGSVHADSYIVFLHKATDRLDTQYTRGRIVPTDSLLRYRVIQRRTKRQGHVVVYEVIGGVLVRILRYFHTAQDWQTRLTDELR